MTNTEKMLEEFEKILMRDGLSEDWYHRTPLEKQRVIDALFSTSIHQAIAEERERVREKANKLRKDHSFKVHEVGDIAKEAYNQALDDLLSLDKPLTEYDGSEHIKHHTENRCVDWCPKCPTSLDKLTDK